VRLFTFFIDKTALGAPRLQVGDRPIAQVDIPVSGGYVPPEVKKHLANDPIPTETTAEIPLAAIAHARSGDKGNSSNIAIIARKPEYLPLLRRELTPERIVAHLGHLVRGPAKRFEAPGLNALNFLIEDALGGGGMASRRIDPQGKAYGQMALEMSVRVPLSWAVQIRMERRAAEPAPATLA
jgi:hypothetical protein